MVSLTNFKRVRDHDELAIEASYDNPGFVAVTTTNDNNTNTNKNDQHKQQQQQQRQQQQLQQPESQSPESLHRQEPNQIRILVGGSASPGTMSEPSPGSSTPSAHTAAGGEAASTGSSGDSGVMENQQSAISFYSASSSASTASAPPSPSSSSDSSRRRHSTGPMLEGVTDEDGGSFVGDSRLFRDHMEEKQQQQQPVSDREARKLTKRRARSELDSTMLDIIQEPGGATILKLGGSSGGKQMKTDNTLNRQIEHPNHNQSDDNNKMRPPLSSMISSSADRLKNLGEHNHQELLLDGQHFEIRWNDLNYQVQPKWYQQKWLSFSSSSSSSPATSNGVANESHLLEAGHKLGAKSNKSKISILNNLNGSVRSGQVTAILGPSGAGKTSLLGCLTGKHRMGVSGTIQVRGGADRPLTVCTIPQKDYLLNQLTVRENLWFASRLKHPDDPFDHDSNINRVLDLLKLQSCVDTKISKISGGQYKRVSIAQELLSNPDILILDEPTSGLDSLTCYKTVMVLTDLAQLSPNPMAIIVTIHQPQREVYDLFHHVYILAIGGQAIYEGRPRDSIATINKCSGGDLHFDSTSYNPASFLVEIASAEYGLKRIESLVEHQLADFRRRTQEQDYQQYQQAMLLAASTPGGAPGVATGWLAGTPGGHRKKESPIVARLKSTFGLGGGAGSGSGGGSPKVSGPHDSLASSTYLGLPTIPEPVDGSRLELSPNNNNNNSGATMSTDSIGSGGAGTASGEFYLDDRLQTHKHNHEGHFLRHCHLLTKRSWLCLCKDPMLTTLRFAAHIFVPLLITLVYGNRVGKPNACPLYESDMDLIDYAKRGATRLLGLQDELRCTFENVGLYFLSVYAFTFSTMCLTSLSFPLNMHVLLKEVRNGWYSIPTFFIGKTLADFPLEFILPAVTLIITYPLTGQPSSYMEWRFLAGIAIFVLTSLIAQTQGLIFGALFMNAMQAAVFVAPVSTTPLILLSGFLIRIGQMPRYLQVLSCFSYFRYAIEGLTIVRYGFGMCPCDPDLVTGQPVTASGVPEQLRTMTNYWLSTFNQPGPTLDEELDRAGSNATLGIDGITTITTTTVGPQQDTDFFQELTVLLARANSFGANITTCDDLKPYPMIDFNLRDHQLYVWMGALVATLIVFKVVNYLVVKYSVKFRL